MVSEWIIIWTAFCKTISDFMLLAYAFPRVATDV